MKLYQKYPNRFFSPGIRFGYSLVLKTAPWYVKLFKVRGVFVSTSKANYWLGFFND